MFKKINNLDFLFSKQYSLILFAISLFRVAQETGIPALTLLSEFEGTSGVNLNVQLAYYLNLIRNRATLLGVGVAVQPNFYPARAVLE